MTLDPRPDQISDPPAAVLAPGGASGVFKGRLVVVSGTGYSGVFVYAPGPPGTGNLIAEMSNGGTDPYGNPFNAGVETIDALGRNLTMFGRFLTWSKNTDTPDNPPLILADPSHANGNSLEITTGEGVSTDSPAALTFYDSSASAGVTGIPAGQPGIFVPADCPIVCDDWHPMGGMSSGWTVGGHASYKLLPTGWLGVAFKDLVPGTATDGTVIWAAGSLPSGYQVGNNHRVVAYTNQIRVSGGSFEMAALEFETDGSIQCFGVAGASPRLDLYAAIPLDDT